MVFEQHFDGITTCFNKFNSDYVITLKLSQVGRDAASSNRCTSPRVCSPPQQGYYKLNTNGSWLSLGEAGAGGLIRCYKGKWQIGYSMKIKTLGPASFVLIAIREGLYCLGKKNSSS